MKSWRSSSSECRCTRRRKPTMRTQAGKWMSWSNKKSSNMLKSSLTGKSALTLSHSSQLLLHMLWWHFGKRPTLFGNLRKVTAAVWQFWAARQGHLWGSPFGQQPGCVVAEFPSGLQWFRTTRHILPEVTMQLLILWHTLLSFYSGHSSLAVALHCAHTWLLGFRMGFGVWGWGQSLHLLVWVYISSRSIHSMLRSCFAGWCCTKHGICRSQWFLEQATWWEKKVWKVVCKNKASSQGNDRWQLWKWWCHGWIRALDLVLITKEAEVIRPPVLWCHWAQRSLRHELHVLAADCCRMPQCRDRCNHSSSNHLEFPSMLGISGYV